MPYHVSRNGQTYGPYTLEDLQRYVASGNILATDLAKSDEMPEWVPVSQILGASVSRQPRLRAATLLPAGLRSRLPGSAKSQLGPRASARLLHLRTLCPRLEPRHRRLGKTRPAGQQSPDVLHYRRRSRCP